MLVILFVISLLPLPEPVVTSSYGFRPENEIIRHSGGELIARFHAGIDMIPSSFDSPAYVYAVEKGTVIDHYPIGGVYQGHADYGGYIVIRHTNYCSHYGHFRAWSTNLRVREGMEIEQGYILGIMGNTGKSTGAHLDFRISDCEGSYLPIVFSNNQILVYKETKE